MEFISNHTEKEKKGIEDKQLPSRYFWEYLSHWLFHFNSQECVHTELYNTEILALTNCHFPKTNKRNVWNMKHDQSMSLVIITHFFMLLGHAPIALSLKKNTQNCDMDIIWSISLWENSLLLIVSFTDFLPFLAVERPPFWFLHISKKCPVFFLLNLVFTNSLLNAVFQGRSPFTPSRWQPLYCFCFQIDSFVSILYCMDLIF